MKSEFKNLLFKKNILVGSIEADKEKAFYTMFALANKFNIKVTESAQYLTESNIRDAADNLGEYVPEPFYKGFPQSVLALTSEQLLIDQLLHYFDTYALGNFEGDAAHSLFEEQFERLAFKEKCEIKEFRVVTEEEALKLVNEAVNDLLKSTRPLSATNYDLVLTWVKNYDYSIDKIASKNTTVKLLLDTREISFINYINLSDVIKLVEELNYRVYNNKNIKKLNFKNQDRKFISVVLDTLFNKITSETAFRDIKMQCAEKRKIWNGLLYHIHYEPINRYAKDFIEAMASNDTASHMGNFEALMRSNHIDRAVRYLSDSKGSTAVLRNLNYILSRCETTEDVKAVVSQLNFDNPIAIIQLLISYNRELEHSTRNFKFTKFNKLKVHTETVEEVNRRKSYISETTKELLKTVLKENLANIYKGKLSKVYIEQGMENMAVPLQETTSNSGYGTLPKGSRIPLNTEGKKVRLFTYWEKVNDIDLSSIAINRDGTTGEFSWRTMARNQSAAVTFSGDQTRGFNGGSEYIDVDIERFKEKYPKTKYLIVCDNVFTGGYTFNKCHCTAGYMLRDKRDSGQVFEPKTVKSSFKVTGDSSFNYLFAIDMDTEEFIWLNIIRDSNAPVAGTTNIKFITEYLEVAKVINVKSLFEMLATEVVSTPEEAEVVVSDTFKTEDESIKIIHSYDTEVIMKYLNNKE